MSATPAESMDDPVIPEAAPGVRVGARLRAAREAAGLEIGDLSSRLRLGSRQVQALENGDWASLPGKTFTRGFVRNYAKVVNLDPAPLLAQLDGENELVAPGLDFPVSTHVTMPNQGGAPRKDLLTVAAGLFLVVLAVLAYFFLPDQFWVQAPPPVAATTEGAAAPGPGEPVLPPADTAAAQDASAPQLNVAPSQPILPEPAPAPTDKKGASVPAVQATGAVEQPSVAAAVPAPPTQPGVAGDGVLSFRFAKASWVEVRDREGNLLVSRLHPEGSAAEIRGTAPFSVVVGNAANVQLQYRGKAVVLEPNVESGVARLTLQ